MELCDSSLFRLLHGHQHQVGRSLSHSLSSITQPLTRYSPTPTHSHTHSLTHSLTHSIDSVTLVSCAPYLCPFVLSGTIGAPGRPLGKRLSAAFRLTLCCIASMAFSVSGWFRVQSDTIWIRFEFERRSDKLSRSFRKRGGSISRINESNGHSK